MINSETVIHNKGTYTDGVLNNINLEPRFPITLPNGIRQDIINNIPRQNDVIVDSEGNVWKVNTLVHNEDNTFNCNLSILNSENNIINEIVGLEKCAMITPNSGGLLAPYYHDSYVTTSAFRAAMSYNMMKYTQKLNYSLIAFFDFNGNLSSSIPDYNLVLYGPAISYQSDMLGCSNPDITSALIDHNSGFVFDNFDQTFLSQNYVIEMEFKLDKVNAFESLIIFEQTGPLYKRLNIYDQLLVFNLEGLTENRINNTIIDNTKFNKIKFIKNNQKLTIYVNDIKELEYENINNMLDNVTSLYFFNNKFDVTFGNVFLGKICNIKLSRLFDSTNNILHFNFMNTLRSEAYVDSSSELTITRYPIKYKTIESSSKSCLKLIKGYRLKLENVDTILPDQTNFIIEMELEVNSVYQTYFDTYYLTMALLLYSTPESTQINRLLWFSSNQLYIIYNDNPSNCSISDIHADSSKRSAIIDRNHTPAKLYPNIYNNIKFVKQGNDVSIYINDIKAYVYNEYYGSGFTGIHNASYTYSNFNDTIKELYFCDSSYSGYFSKLDTNINFIKLYSGTIDTKVEVCNFDFTTDLKCSINQNIQLTNEYINCTYPSVIGALPQYFTHTYDDMNNTKDSSIKAFNIESLQLLITTLLPDQTNFFIDMTIGLNYGCTALEIKKSDNTFIKIIKINFRDTVDDKSSIEVPTGKLNISTTFGNQNLNIRLHKIGNIANVYIDGIIADVISNENINLGSDIPFNYNITDLYFGTDSNQYWGPIINYIRIYQGIWTGPIWTAPRLNESATIASFDFNNTLKCSKNPNLELIYNELSVPAAVLPTESPIVVVYDKPEVTSIDLSKAEYLHLPDTNLIFPDLVNFMIELNISFDTVDSRVFYDMDNLGIPFPLLVIDRSELTIPALSTTHSSSPNNLVLFREGDHLAYDKIPIFITPNKIYNIKFIKRDNIISVKIDNIFLHFTYKDHSWHTIDLGTTYDFTNDTVLTNIVNSLTDLYFCKSTYRSYQNISSSYNIDSIKLYHDIDDILIANFEFTNNLNCSINLDNTLLFEHNTFIEEEVFNSYGNGLYGIRLSPSMRNIILTDFITKINNIQVYTICMNSTFYTAECIISNCPLHTITLLKFGNNANSIKLTFEDSKFHLIGFEESENQIINYTQTSYINTDWTSLPSLEDGCRSLWCDIRFVKNGNILSLYTSSVLSIVGLPNSSPMIKQFECVIPDNRLDETSLCLFDYDHGFNNVYLYDLFIKSGIYID